MYIWPRVRYHWLEFESNVGTGIGVYQPSKYQHVVPICARKYCGIRKIISGVCRRNGDKTYLHLNRFKYANNIRLKNNI